MVLVSGGGQSGLKPPFTEGPIDGKDLLKNASDGKGNSRTLRISDLIGPIG